MPSNPLSEEIKEYWKQEILNAFNNQLYKMYDDVSYNIKCCPGPKSLIDEWKLEQDFILSVMKDRNMVLPTFWNKLLGKV